MRESDEDCGDDYDDDNYGDDDDDKDVEDNDDEMIPVHCSGGATCCPLAGKMELVLVESGREGTLMRHFIGEKYVELCVD